MPIFISYNHTDKDFAETLAMHLVQAKQNVWIDKWELNAGDSLIARIEDALGDADAILVLLSKTSIESEWCKKELRSGIVRELEEKSVLVIPIILDDCKIPLFLREKLHVDFRKDRDEQLELLLRSLDRVSNPSQARAEAPEYHVDWAMTSVNQDGQAGIEWTFVNHGEKLPYVVLTQVLFWPSGASQRTLSSLKNDDLRFRYAAECMKRVLDEDDELQVLLSSVEPTVLSRTVDDKTHGGMVTILITTRRLGSDNGMDTLVHIDNNLRDAIRHTLGATRMA